MGTPKEEERKLLFATWGDPETWVQVKYLVVKEEDDKLKIEEVGEELFSSTTALMRLLKPTRTRIFVQDSLYLKEITRGKEKRTHDRLKRSAIEERVKNLVLDAKKERRDEEEKKKFNEEIRELGLENILVVPGIISYRDGANIYVWRGDNFYEVLVGSLIEHILSELRMENASRIGVVIDTTHGVNYFVVALTEACRLASAIYLLERSPSIKNINIRILRYNSDPLLLKDSDMRGASVKVNLIAREELRGVASNFVLPTLENLVSRGLSEAANTLNNHWHEEEPGEWKREWEKALAACLLFFRGLPIWALRIAQETRVPDTRELLEVMKNIELKHEKESEERNVVRHKYTYEWGPKKPRVEVVVVSEVVKALKNFKEKLHSEECRERVEKMLTEFLHELKNTPGQDAKCPCVEKFVETIEKAEQHISGTFCYDLEELVSIVENVYSKNVSRLLTYEINKLNKRLKRNPDIKRKLDMSCTTNNITYSVDDCKHPKYLTARNKELTILIPSEEGTSIRNLYAHAGFARGSLYVAALFNEKLYACPIDWEKYLDVLKTNC